MGETGAAGGGGGDNKHLWVLVHDAHQFNTFQGVREKVAPKSPPEGKTDFRQSVKHAKLYFDLLPSLQESVIIGVWIIRILSERDDLSIRTGEIKTAFLN